jgi:hypothetical protein
MRYNCLVKWSVPLFLTSIPFGNALPAPGSEVAVREENQSENIDKRQGFFSHPMNVCPDPTTSFAASYCVRDRGPRALAYACNNPRGWIDFPDGSCNDDEICVDTIDTENQLAYCVSHENWVRIAFNQAGGDAVAGDQVTVLPEGSPNLPINTVVQAVTITPDDLTWVVDANIAMNSMNCAKSGLSQWNTCSGIYEMTSCTNCPETNPVVVPAGTNQISVQIDNPAPFDLYVGWLSPL